MPWEHRKQGKYRFYYRNERLPDGRVKKTYLGNGPIAQRAAQRDADARAQREAGRSHDLEQVRQSEAVLAPARSLTRALDEALKMLTTATLLAGNLHQHKGQWRVRRER